MNLNLGKFKKIKEDEHSAVLEHPAGHQILIAKKILSPESHQELSKLPFKFAEGGKVLHYWDNPTEVPSTDEPNASYPTADPADTTPTQKTAPTAPEEAPKQPDYFTNGTFDVQKYAAANADNPDVPIEERTKLLSLMNSQKDIEKNSTAAADAVEKQKILDYNAQAVKAGKAPLPVADSAPTTPANVPSTNIQGPDTPIVSKAPQNPYANDTYGAKAATDIYNQGIAGIAGTNGHPSSFEQEATAQGAQNQAKAQVLNTGANAQQAQLQKTLADQKELHGEINNIAADVKTNQIQPNHYLNSMSTGQKIQTAIGLFLGGLGAGLTHTRNDNLDFMNDQIKNDVTAQAQNLQSKNNLVSAFVAQGHNVNDAQQLAEASLRSIYADKVESAALKTGNPLMMARAQQAKNQFLMQNANEIGSMTARKNLLGGSLEKGQDSLQSIAQKIPYLYPNPTEQAAAMKELGQAEETLKAKDSALDVFDKLTNINTIGNRLANPISGYRDTAALRDNAAIGLAYDEAHRVNEFEFEAAKKTFKQPGDKPPDLAFKRQNLLNIANKKLNTPILDKMGLGAAVRNSGRYDINGVDRLPPPTK